MQKECREAGESAAMAVLSTTCCDGMSCWQQTGIYDWLRTYNNILNLVEPWW